MEPFFARTAEIAVRMATIVAWGCGRMEVIREDMEWARDVALWSASNMAASAGIYMAENADQKRYKKTLRFIRDAGENGISRRDLMRKIDGAITVKDIESLLKQAIEGGEISEDKTTPRKGGTASVSYRFVKC